MPVDLDKLYRDAAAVLYIADELEPEEREAFARRLAGDPQLAAEVKQARAAQLSVAGELERADAHTRLAAGEGVAVRRVSRAITAWLDNRVVATAPPAKKGLLLPWWAYPTTAAASLIVGFLVWSSRQEVRPLEPSAEAQRGISMLEAEQAELAEWLTTSLDTTTTADASMDVELEQLLSVGGAEDLNAVYLSPRREENSQ